MELLLINLSIRVPLPTPLGPQTTRALGWATAETSSASCEASSPSGLASVELAPPIPALVTPRESAPSSTMQGMLWRKSGHADPQVPFPQH